MYTLYITEAAASDIRGAWLWYESQKTGLGGALRATLSKIIEDVALHPYAYQLRYDAVRIVFLYSYPYGLHYTVREKEKEIILLGLFHTALSPKKWEKRKPNG